MNQFTWSDYHLVGNIPLFLGDYTLKAYGSDRRISSLAEKLTTQIRTGNVVNGFVNEYWGIGKSTLLYNLCYLLNSSLFNEPQMEVGKNRILALYCEKPTSPKDLLDYTVANGLPITWDPTRGEKEDVHELRLESLHEILQKIAADMLERSPNRKLIPTHQQSDLDGLSRALSGYVENLATHDDLPGKVDYDFAYEFGRLVYPIASLEFLNSFNALFRSPRKNLRDFEVFREVCLKAGIHIMLVIDESEDWRSVSQYRLDQYLLDVIADHRISFILTFRTEVDRRLRSSNIKIRYYIIKGSLEKIEFPNPSDEDIIEMTRGILSFSRPDYSLELTPFTREFIISLSHRTKRGGRFNPRLFLRSIIRILALSQTWKRDRLTIDASFVDHRDVRKTIVDVYRDEEFAELREPITNISLDILKRKELADEISEWMIRGKVDPMNRFTFEIVKTILSKRFGLPVPSDLEVLSYIDDEKTRGTVQRLLAIVDGKITEKRIESNVSSCKHEEWEYTVIWDKVNNPQDGRVCKNCGKVEKY